MRECFLALIIFYNEAQEGKIDYYGLGLGVTATGVKCRVVEECVVF